MYKRDLQSVIQERCFQGKAIILLGARQVGKTTLLKKIIQEQHVDALYLNCDEPQTISALTNCNLKELQMIVGVTNLQFAAHDIIA